MNKKPTLMPFRLILRQFSLQVGLFFILLFLLFAFQNCSGQAPVSGSRDLSSQALNLPFAYDIKIDHVGYMSCSNMPGGYDPTAFFSFKVGGYDLGSGVGLRDEFLQATRSYSVSQRADSFALSSKNAGVSAHLSIRSTSDYQQFFAAQGAINIGSFMVPLSDPRIAGTLATLTPNQRANSFSALPLASQRAESRINYNANELIQQDLRNVLQNGSGLLAVTFNQPSKGQQYAAGSIENSGSSVYGVGYAVQFRLPVGYFSGPARTLSSLNEINLENNQSTGQAWSCPADFVFKIVRPQDVGVRVNCSSVNMTGEPTPQNVAQQAAYNAIRKILPSQSWALDLVNKCAVPKVSGLCYGIDGGALNIQYNAGSSCSGQSCPHFVSVCKRS